MALDRSVVNLRSFRSDWLKLRFLGPSINGNRSLKVKDANRGGRKVDLLPLHGPWSAVAVDEKAAADTGLDERTLTALFELDSAAFHRALRSSSSASLSAGQAPIEDIFVEYNNRRNWRDQDPLANPIEFIQLDYLSSTDPR